MLHFRSVLQRFRLSDKAVPVVFLAILFLSFGLMIPFLGIYQDDWVFVYNAYVRGSQGLWDFLNADGTPFSSLMNIGLFRLLGVKPLHWHVAALLARWLTVVAFWLVLRRLWPANPLKSFTVSLLFAVYPFFNLQPLAFTYLHIWISYLFLGLSLYWMILSVQIPQKYILYTGLALAAGAISGLTAEYFMGLEFLRPVLLWLVLVQPSEKGIQARLFRMIRLWSPYLLLFGLYVWWRFFVYQVPIENRNEPVGLEMLLSQPLAEIRILLSNLLPDLISIVIASWYKVLDPLFFNLADRRSLLLIGLSLVAGLGIFWIVGQYKKEEPAGREDCPDWARQAFWLGITILVLGLIPPYAGGLFINEKNPLWNSRFGLASMLGAAMLIAVALELLSSRARTRLVLIAVLIGLSVGYHARYTNDFRAAWKKESNLFRQLVLRIPALQPGTALVADEEILFYMGDYPTAYAINTIYRDPFTDTDPSIDYWFFSMTSNFGSNLDAFLDGAEIDAAHRSMSFVGRSDESIIISFQPDQEECLYVIRPQDSFFRKLKPLLKEASHLSALDRIDTKAPSGSSFLKAIDLQYPEDWCTYYQRADLARQKGEPEKVVEFWEQARRNGFSPGVYFEYFLFLDAFSALSQWEQAAQVSFEAIQRFPVARLAMCDYWNSTPATAERETAFEKLNAKLDCFSE
jgi:hypothetical protein